MKFEAHRGVGTECPENTMPAFQAAAAQGYAMIETDPLFTADGVCVLLHDRMLNRTCRNADGSEIAGEICMDAISYEEALAYDAGLAKARKYKGTKIPTLQELLNLSAKTGIAIKLDNRIQSFTETQTAALFDLIAASKARAGFTVSDFSYLDRVLARFPDAEIHYDGPVDAAALAALQSRLRREQLTVWLCLPSEETAWVTVPKADAALCAAVKRVGQLGIWLLKTQKELEQAQAYGADLVETPGQLKPLHPYEGLSDCHTHSFYSHDSACDPADSLRAAQAHGLAAFAITDHCDIEFCRKQDVQTPVCQSVAAAKALNAAVPGLRVLSGVEMGEAIWYEDAAADLLNAAHCDVVIGSVHAVRYPGYSMPYSQIDFSRFSEREKDAFLAAYFDDLLEMAQTADFDILAHLTCPVRYIHGKYHRSVDLTRYQPQIDAILKSIVEKGAALEVNTSGFHEPEPYLMPELSIVKRYLAFGGTLITLGSDAHQAENMANGFAQAVQMLKSIDVHCLCRYENRIAIPYAIE